MDKRRAIQIMTKAAEIYRDNLEDQKVLFLYGLPSDVKKQLQIEGKILSSIQGYEVAFHRYNFLHLTGVKLNKSGTASAIHFYQKCLDKRLTENDLLCGEVVASNNYNKELEKRINMAIIELKKLTKSYGKNRGIIDVNLEVKEGEFFGFIGPNGAGKSTAIRTMLGMIKVTSGEGKVLGFDIQKENTKILAEIGYLPSEAVFYSGMKVKDILKLSADLHKKDCTEECARLCERLQLDVNRKVDELSFGNRKKVGIVCALQHNPRLLILDEPTSGLDPLMQKEFFNILKERNDKGTTIFLSSHVLWEVQNYCKRAAIIREGRLIACDNIEALAKTNAKRVTVVGDVSVEGLDGVKDERKEFDKLSFLYSGDMNDLISYISKYKIKDISIMEPDLEEVFMHYYKEEEK